ncbi:MAG: SGNH/GDSL hydrolase family protein [Bacillota bacterium]
MEKIFVLVTLIVCGIAIIFGNLHWNNKISAQGKKVTNTVEIVDTAQEMPKDEVKQSEILTYTSNLPEELQEKVKNAASSGKPLQLVIYGSNATSTEEGAWPDLLSKELNATYGENVFEITVLSNDKTTRDLVIEKTYEEINELQPDILLFEPSMLKDNGLIGIINTLENIQTMVVAWQDANEEMTLMIQPSNPIYSATYYPSEVSQLKDYAEKNDIIYLNHWENWPDLEDAKMEDHLTKSNEPNKSGNKVWAEYVINYFIAK